MSNLCEDFKLNDENMIEAARCVQAHNGLFFCEVWAIINVVIEGMRKHSRGHLMKKVLWEPFYGSESAESCDSEV